MEISDEQIEAKDVAEIELLGLFGMAEGKRGARECAT